MRERAMQRGQVWKKANGLYAIRWYDAAGNCAETYRGSVTLAWYVRDVH